MPKFKEYSQNQTMLLPPNITDWLPKDHQCFVINEIIDKLNISCVEETYSDNGASAYDPRMLVKIIFYSYAKGIRSSRKIEDLTYENIVYRYLSANQFPDHGTINLFRKNHLKDLENLFAQIVILCDGLGIVDPTDVSIDGSIFKASASKKSTYDQETITKLKKKIGEILREAEEIDKKEDEKYGNQRGYSELPEKLKDPETRKKEIERLQEKMRKLEEANQAIEEKQAKAKSKREKDLNRNKTQNTTDPDAKLMKIKKGKTYEPSYNGQIVTNNQIILAYEITDEGVDTNLLHPMIKKTENNIRKRVAKVKADSSYFSKNNMEKINEKEIDAYIPDKAKAKEERQERNNEIPKYDRRNFKYNEEKDEFICPQGKRLRLVRTDQETKKYMCSDCSSCPFKSQCAKGKNKYLNHNPQLEKYKSEMRTKLNSIKGKHKYLERMSDVEPVFGNIIYNQKAGNFLCRGKPMVKIEFGLSCLAHNLTKIANWIKKNNESEQLEILARL